MFGRVKEAAKKVADAVAQPSVEQARAAVEQRQKELLAAKAALDAADQALDAVIERGAEEAETLKAQAAITSAGLTAERAQRTLDAAQRRLMAAEERERAIEGTRGRAALAEVIAERERAADKIAEGLALVREGLAGMDACDSQLAELQAAGHLTRDIVAGYNYSAGTTRARLDVEMRDIADGPLSQRPVAFADWARIVGTTALAS